MEAPLLSRHTILHRHSALEVSSVLLVVAIRVYRGELALPCCGNTQAQGCLESSITSSCSYYTDKWNVSFAKVGRQNCKRAAWLAEVDCKGLIWLKTQVSFWINCIRGGVLIQNTSAWVFMWKKKCYVYCSICQSIIACRNLFGFGSSEKLPWWVITANDVWFHFSDQMASGSQTTFSQLFQRLAWLSCAWLVLHLRLRNTTASSCVVWLRLPKFN